MKYSLTFKTSYIAFQSKKREKVILWITLVYNISVKGINVKVFFCLFSGKSRKAFMTEKTIFSDNKSYGDRSSASSFSTNSFSSSLTALNAANISSSEPLAFAGSGNPLWIMLPPFRYAGQLS